MPLRDFNPDRKENAYLYRGTVIRVIDGDTVEIEIDMGFDIKFKGKFRL